MHHTVLCNTYYLATGRQYDTMIDWQLAAGIVIGQNHACVAMQLQILANGKPLDGHTSLKLVRQKIEHVTQGTPRIIFTFSFSLIYCSIRYY